MPATATSVSISGSFSDVGGTAQLVLAERIDGHDTFLTGLLELDGRVISIRIITLDDVTVLRPVEPDGFAGISRTCVGVLHLPHGARPRSAPPDLVAEALEHHRTLDHLDEAELRYALTFLEEATTAPIRRARIRAIVDALPSTAAGSPAAGEPR
jgi:hypothetical protein